MKVGILGAGQLAQMLAHAAEPLGIACICLANSLNDPAAQVAKLQVINPNDQQKLIAFAKEVDVITFENENIDGALADLLAQHCGFYPSFSAIHIAQDRLLEKQFLSELNIPVAPFADIETADDLVQAITILGTPCILKTRRFGYDGKGQAFIKTVEEATAAWKSLQGQPLILEGFIDFSTELSIVSVRNASGDIRHYPLTENQHRKGVLRESHAPYKNPILQEQAEHYSNQLLASLNYVGVLTIEFFVKNCHLIANEIAPRVHNSGHWTIEGAVTSQFENHIRAILNLALGETAALAPTTMINCIGKLPTIETILQISEAHYHTYHKSPRPHRKLGHITLVNRDPITFEQQYQALKKEI